MLQLRIITLFVAAVCLATGPASAARLINVTADSSKVFLDTWIGTAHLNPKSQYEEGPVLQGAQFSLHNEMPYPYGSVWADAHVGPAPYNASSFELFARVEPDASINWPNRGRGRAEMELTWQFVTSDESVHCRVDGVGYGGDAASLQVDLFDKTDGTTMANVFRDSFFGGTLVNANLLPLHAYTMHLHVIADGQTSGDPFASLMFSTDALIVPEPVTSMLALAGVTVTLAARTRRR